MDGMAAAEMLALDLTVCSFVTSFKGGREFLRESCSLGDDIFASEASGDGSESSSSARDVVLLVDCLVEMVEVNLLFSRFRVKGTDGGVVVEDVGGRPSTTSFSSQH